MTYRSKYIACRVSIAVFVIGFAVALYTLSPWLVLWFAAWMEIGSTWRDLKTGLR